MHDVGELIGMRLKLWGVKSRSQTVKPCFQALQELKLVRNEDFRAWVVVVEVSAGALMGHAGLAIAKVTTFARELLLFAFLLFDIVVYPQ